jgi:heme/copper-type cytochrome/quinol oxidase subunit 3
MSPVYLQAETPADHAPPPVLLIDDRRGTIGIALLIASEATLFAVLFFSYYYLESGNAIWKAQMPPKLHYSVPMLVVLLTSSAVLHMGEKRMKERRYGAARSALMATIGLGFIFIVLSYFEYSEHLKSLTPTTNSYGSIFYMITSLHLTHVVVGLILMLWLVSVPRWEPAQYYPHRPYHNVAMYWHFVDTVWFWVVMLLYVIPNIRHYP